MQNKKVSKDKSSPLRKSSKKSPNKSPKRSGLENSNKDYEEDSAIRIALGLDNNSYELVKKRRDLDKSSPKTKQSSPKKYGRISPNKNNNSPHRGKTSGSPT